MPMIDMADGVRLFVQDWGQGTPFVFVHGWPYEHHIFENQMAALGYYHGTRVMGLDLRGFGQSDKPWDGHDYDTWVADLRTVFAQLDLHDIMLVGFQMGGAVAAHYVATQEDKRVTRLVLCAAALPSLAATPTFPYGLPPFAFDGFVAGIREEDTELMRQFIVKGFHNQVSEARLRYYERIATMPSLRARIRAMDQMRQRDLTEELPGINVPTLIVHGVHDNFVPFAAAEAQQRLIPGASLVRFENSGHNLFWDEKEKLVQELLIFFKDTAPLEQAKKQG